MVAAAVIGGSLLGAAATSAASSKASATQNRAIDAQSSVQQQQLDLAHEQWNRYKDTYGPLEDEFANEAKDYGSEANRQKAAAEAGGDVTSSYAGLRQQLNSTPGLDPSSQKYLDTIRKLGVSEAAQTAAAETGARRNVDSQGLARMQDAISMGKGLPSNASSALNGAASSAAALGQMGVQQGAIAGQNAAGIGRMVGGLATNPAVASGVASWFKTPGGADPMSTINEPAQMPAYGGTAANVADTIPTEVFSDRRLKTDITWRGVAPNGLSLYSFRYVWGGAMQLGHMAQEVMRQFPGAVRRHASGFLMVDYAKV